MKKLMLLALAVSASSGAFAQYVAEVDGLGHTDTYLLIYQNSFNAATPLANLMDGDDDFSGTFTVLTGTGQGFASSRIGPGEATNYTGGAGLSLTQGVQYIAVVTGFDNPDFGAYKAGIGGPAGAAFWTGDTTNGATFNRPTSLTALSGFATAVRYETQLFYVDGNRNVQLGAVPEPGTMIALGAGLAALAARRRRK